MHARNWQHSMASCLLSFECSNATGDFRSGDLILDLIQDLIKTDEEMQRFSCQRFENPTGFADRRFLAIRRPQILSQHENVYQVQIEQNLHRPPTLNFISIGTLGIGAGERLHLSLQGSVVKITDSINGSTIASVSRSHSNNDMGCIQDKSRFDFGSLPTEMQVKILSYLSWFDLKNTARVCKQWKKISKSARDVKRYLRMEAANEDTVIDDKILDRWLGENKILKCFKHNQHCDLRMSALEILGSRCPLLEVLDLSTVHLTDEGLKVIAKGCGNLKRGSFQCPRITELGIKYLFDFCKGFEHLEIIGNHRITGLNLFGDSFPNFKTLVLDTCQRIHDFSGIFQSFPNLVSLTLKHLYHLDDDHLKSIFKNCTKIERLEIHFLPRVSCVGLQSIAGLGNLKSLSLDDIVPLCSIDRALNDISKNCWNLSNLNISSCHSMSDFGAQSLGALPNLETLSLNYMLGITSKSLETISSCQNLKSLSIEGCASVDNSGPLAVVAKCLNLELLKVSYIRQINSDFIVNCYKYFNDVERHAKTLNIEVRGCSVFTAELMKQCPLLRAYKIPFFAKCRQDGRWGANTWLWVFSEIAQD